MVAGKLEARGRGFSNIKFTLQDYSSSETNETVENTNVNSHVRFSAGRTFTEGRLQVFNLIYYFK